MPTDRPQSLQSQPTENHYERDEDEHAFKMGLLAMFSLELENLEQKKLN